MPHRVPETGLEGLEGQVRALAAHVEALTARVAVLEGATPQNVAAGHILPRRLLVAIVQAVRGRAFTARELRVHAVVDRDLREALDGLTVKQIGRRLAALAGTVTVDGVTIAKIGQCEDGCIWSLVSQVPAGVRARAGA
jgi:hypothetical protein